MKKAFEIAIDGPVAAGKGTIAPKLAKALGGYYLYTGAMYRCLALLCLEKGVFVDNEKQIEPILSDFNIDFVEDRVMLNGQDVTQRIKERDVTRESSRVAVFPKIRERMILEQRKVAEREIQKEKIVVAEGRDTGTRLFPDAPVKIFLTATPRVRAKRRLDQLILQGDREVSFETVLKEVEERDERDLQRDIDPLVSDPEKEGYFVLDNSEIDEDKTIGLIVDHLKEKGLYD